VLSTTGTTVSACASAAKRLATKALFGTKLHVRASALENQRRAAQEDSSSIPSAVCASHAQNKTVAIAQGGSGTQSAANASASLLSVHLARFGGKISATATQKLIHLFFQSMKTDR
jgi:hypothetical protein